jgi:hypothetical protein
MIVDHVHHSSMTFSHGLTLFYNSIKSALISIPWNDVDCSFVIIVIASCQSQEIQCRHSLGKTQGGSGCPWCIVCFCSLQLKQ